MKILSFFCLVFISIAPSRSFAVLQPGIPDAVTAANSTSYTLNGYCTAGNGNVTISFGGLTMNTPCLAVAGAYRYTGNVSSEITTNPIRQCVDQVPLTSICSEYTNNELAPPNIFFDFSPLVLIDDTNESSYTVSGLCAPTGASISLNIGPFTGIINGVCDSYNRFMIRNDVSIVPDGLGLTALVTIDDNGSTSTAATTVDKALEGLDPIPSIINVTTTIIDVDSDTWLEANDSINISIEFSEVVTTSAAVRLIVGISSGEKFATYQSGTGTTTLTFKLDIVSNDEQCDGRLVLIELDLNGGSIADSGGQDANLRSLPNTLSTEKIDAVAPSFEFPIDILTIDATPNSSPEVGGDDFRGEDNCVAATIEVSIGETPGGEEVTSFLPVPANAFTYRISNGVDGFSFTLLPSIGYYVSVRAIDQAGHVSSLNSTEMWSTSSVFNIPKRSRAFKAF